MTANSQLLTTTPKQKQKQTKQRTRTGTEPENGDHMEGYQEGSERGRVLRISSINGR